MLLQDSNARCKITKKNTKNADKCYVNYESWTRKVIHIFQVDFQQKLSLCFAHIACKINNHLCFRCWCASFYNTFTISDILMKYCFYCVTICKYSAALGKVEFFIFYQNRATHFKWNWHVKRMMMMKTIESNTQFIPYFTLNWIFSKCTF